MRPRALLMRPRALLMRPRASTRGEGRRGSASSILFLLIKPLHQEMNVTKGIFSVYVHTLKVSYQLRYSHN